MREWQESSLQMVSSHDWLLHSTRTAGVFWGEAAISHINVYVVCSTSTRMASCDHVVHHYTQCMWLTIIWPTTATGSHLVVLRVCKLLVVLCMWTLTFSSTFTPALCSPPPPAGMMWTTVWPPLWGLDDVSDVTLLKRAVSHMGRRPLTFITLMGDPWPLYSCAMQW